MKPDPGPSVIWRWPKGEIRLEAIARHKDGSWYWTDRTDEMHEFPSLAAAEEVARTEGGMPAPRVEPERRMPLRPPHKPDTEPHIIPPSPGRDWLGEWERNHE